MKSIKTIGLLLGLLSVFSMQGQTKQWTLEECVKYAIDHNISIKLSDLDTQSAEINKKDAFGNFLPSVNANASHSWNVGLNVNPVTNIAATSTTQYSSMGAGVGVDIYKGLQNQNTMRKQKLALIASQYQLTKMQEDVALNVANAFLQVLFNKQNLKVQQEQLAINQKQYERSDEMVKAGSIPRGDLLDVKATVATSQQNVINAENTLLISKLSLAQLLQLKEFANFDVVDENTLQDENNILEKTPMDVYARAKETRTELKIAQTNLEIAEKNVKIARGAFQPTLQGFYNINTRISYADQISIENGTVVSSPAPPFWNQFADNKGQAFGFQLSIPVLNGFSVRNNVERTKVDLERSKIDLEQKELDLQRNVYTAFTDAKGALKAHESAIVALEARQEAFNYATEKYEVGLMNSFDFNQAQTLFTNAQSEVLRTKYDYIFKIKILEFYFGIPIIQN
ncbi:TolC family protein [Flavobacterium agrisoli]|uniref:TolC family protein n=1 Tax=Flavobacterium agrisoli TaxID=2793066 RepID=A0A934PN59_9FLAO|nr:TolC family protein [Flavobacterium agrisoli]MBK0370270.1 TolC family protein [Flavobacterium agrisoli]